MLKSELKARYWRLILVKDSAKEDVFDRVGMGSMGDLGWMEGVERKRTAVV